MDIFMIITLVFNILVTLFSIIETVYVKKKYVKKYDIMTKEFINNLERFECKINSPQFEIVFKNNSYDIQAKKYNNMIYKKNKNRFQIYTIMNESCNFFSNVYHDKDIYCNIRINKNRNFYTIAHFRCQNTLSIKDRLYNIEKNTDLMGITSRNFNKFVISNVDDFRDSNIFMLKNYELKNRCKAIISISLKNQEDLLGVYTIYFSKPLDDKIKLINLDRVLNILKIKLTNLIKEYIELNENVYESINNILIENKITD